MRVRTFLAAAASAAVVVVAISPVEAERSPAPSTGAAPWIAVDAPAGPAPGEELVAERTATTSTFATEVPGRYRTVIAQEPINFRDGAGWKRIDTALTAAGSGSVTNGANSFDLTIAGRSGGQLARVSFGSGRSVAWSLGTATTAARGARPARTTSPLAVGGKREGSHSVRFQEPIPGVTIDLDSTATGVKETLVLASSAVPDVYRFPLELRGLSARIDGSGDVELLGGDGSLVAEIPRGWMIDSSGNGETEQAPATAVTYALVPHGSGQALEVRVDRAWLDDPARVYPVRLDPTLAAGSGDHDDTKVVALVTNTNYSNNARLQVGKDALYQRSFVKFDVSSTIPTGGRVLAADLKLHPEQGTCQAGNPVTVRPVTTSNWKNNPSAPANTYPVWPGPATSAAVAAAQTCPTGGDPWLHLTDDDRLTSGTLTSLVQSWATTPATNYGVGLQATTETSSMTLDLRFTSTEGSGTYPGATWGPRLDVVWDEAPTHLKVSGDDAVPGDDQITPLTYTDFSGGEECYPEYTEAPPGSVWDAWPTSVPEWWPSSPDCKLDLYWKGAPTADQKTAIVVHGGGWTAMLDEEGHGRRTDEEPSRLADALAERGYLVAVIDYRQTLLHFLKDNPDWRTDRFVLLSHCIDRFEQDGSAPKGLPAPASWVPDPGADPLPAECAPLDDPSYDDFLADPGLSYVTNAVADLQQAVKWLRTDPDGVLAGHGLDPGKVFAIGSSAGAVTASGANFDPGSTTANDMRIDGAVALATGHLADDRAIADTGRPMLPPTGSTAAAPLQIQIFEYDVSLPFMTGPVPGALDTAYVGTYDLSRQAAGHLRSQGYTVDLKVRAGFAHTPESDELEQFNDAVGEAVAFFDSLDASIPLDTPQWFAKAPSSGDAFDEFVGQEMIEDQPSTYRSRTGDFNGDDLTDILWWAPGNYLGSIWFGQEDGTFARADSSYPVSGDSSKKRLIPPAFKTSVDWMARYVDDPVRLAADAVTGDFDGDGHDDLYWFRAGGGADLVWSGGADPYLDDPAATATFSESAAGTTASYEQAVVGDFDGDGKDDVYLYETSGNDLLRYGTATQGTFTDHTITASPDGFARIEAGSFDYDTNPSSGLEIADLVFLGGSGGSWTSRYGSATKGTLVTPATHTPATLPTFTDLASGNWNGVDGGNLRLRRDLFFYNSASTGHTIWYADTAVRGRFHAHAVTGPTGTQQLVVGQFDNDPTPCDYDPCDDLILVSPSGNETMLAGKSNWFAYRGFTSTNLGNVVGADRRGIVGRFGDPDVDFAQDDLLWHYTGAGRYDAGPGGSWFWAQD